MSTSSFAPPANGFAKRLSLCNEVIGDLPFDRQCALAAALGYAGLEVAPFTLADDPTTISDRDAIQLRAVAADHGLAISGLHWLLVKPAGFSMTSPDASTRHRTARWMVRCVELCALMGGNYLVHGSGKQRSVWPGQSHAEALALATECWAEAGAAATHAGVQYCVEPLSVDQTSIINTVEQGMAVVRNINQPGLRTMLDTCSGGKTEALPLDQVIDRHWPSGLLAHIQFNDRNLRAPGQGDDRFAPIVQALARQSYRGWLAVEPFDYQPDGPGSAAFAAGYLRGTLQALGLD
jgi:sugar phosphate isomerase/epimerase